MKNKILVLSLLVVFTIIFAGCGKSATVTSSQVNQKQEPKSQTLSNAQSKQKQEPANAIPNNRKIVFEAKKDIDSDGKVERLVLDIEKDYKADEYTKYTGLVIYG